MSDFSYESAAGIAEAIRSKKVSPTEVLEDAIARIEARNPSLNAIVFKGYDDARAAARRAGEQVMKGEALGPLHGVPIAIKDLFDFKPGWPATLGGIRALKNFRPPFYCAFAERMEQRGGAIIVGKTNSPTMGLRGLCDNYLFGPTCNPFDTTRNSGGSSGGSAAAVADGLLPLAEGTDAGGSIRIPASWCGVYGYKASFGRIPLAVRPNAFMSDTPFLFEGPITRTVKDAALAMTAIAGYDVRDPFVLDETLDFVGAVNRSIKGMRIGYNANFDVFPVEPEVAAVVEEALKGFEDAGATVKRVSFGITRSQRELSDLWTRLMMPLNVTGLLGMKAAGIDLLGQHRDDFPPEYLELIDRHMNMTAVELYADQAARTEIYDAIQSAFVDCDIIVTPTLACLPVKNATNGNTLGPTHVNGEEVDRLIGWCLTYPLNLTGHPAASIPAGLSSGGLPVGMQIIGRRYADLDVLAASAAFERARPWAHIYERCRARAL